jgi:hypothetical protein
MFEFFAIPAAILLTILAIVKFTELFDSPSYYDDRYDDLTEWDFDEELPDESEDDGSDENKA